MTATTAVLSLLLIAEFSFAPVSLWTGRTMPRFTWFTGVSPRVATRFLAPVKAATALLSSADLLDELRHLVDSALRPVGCEP